MKPENDNTAGVIAGCIIGVLVVAFLVWLIVRNRKRKNGTEEGEKPAS